MATGPDQAKAILEQDKSASIDGYLVYQLNCWNRVVQTMATSGKPVLYADFQYGGSGGFLGQATASAQRGRRGYGSGHGCPPGSGAGIGWSVPVARPRSCRS